MATPHRGNESTPKMVLHVGLPKTGSSFIQSSLALSRKTLSDSGIHYPEHPSDAAAVSGGISSGNIDAVSPTLVGEDLFRGLSDLPSSAHTLLYSNEMLPEILLENPQALHDIRQVARVEVLAFVRDPVEWLMSAYGQNVKNRGLGEELGEAFVSRWTLPQVTIDFFKLCDELGVELSVRNYSRTRENILAVFANMLSTQSELTLTKPLSTSVNRSLTESEEAFLRAFNRIGFSSTGFLSDSLVNQLPEVFVPPREPSREVVEHLREKYSSVFAELAQYVPDGEAPRFETPPSPYAGRQGHRVHDKARYSLSEEQISVIVAAMASLMELTNNPFATENRRLSSHLEDLEEHLSDLRERIAFYLTKIDALQTEVDAMRASRSWRYTRFLRRKE